MIKADITPEQSIQENLEIYCLEVGSDYEKYAVRSAEKFIEYIGKEPVVDLGCGDGAASKVFFENGNNVIAVDINPIKLDKNEWATTVQADFIEYLSKPVGNLFLHHSLEHYVEPEKVLELIGKNLKKGSYCFIAVPYGGEVHSVHHVVFEDANELVPPNTKVIDAWIDEDEGWPEVGIIVQK